MTQPTRGGSRATSAGDATPPPRRDERPRRARPRRSLDRSTATGEHAASGAPGGRATISAFERGNDESGLATWSIRPSDPAARPAVVVALETLRARLADGQGIGGTEAMRARLLGAIGPPRPDGRRRWTQEALVRKLVGRVHDTTHARTRVQRMRVEIGSPPRGLDVLGDAWIVLETAMRDLVARAVRVRRRGGVEGRIRPGHVRRGEATDAPRSRPRRFAPPPCDAAAVDDARR